MFPISFPSSAVFVVVPSVPELVGMGAGTEGREGEANPAPEPLSCQAGIPTGRTPKLDSLFVVGGAVVVVVVVVGGRAEEEEEETAISFWAKEGIAEVEYEVGSPATDTVVAAGAGVIGRLVRRRDLRDLSSVERSCKD